MKKQSLSILSIIVTVSTLFSQAPSIEWQETIGGNDGDWLYTIHQLNNGGFILGGYSRSGISIDKMEVSQGLEDFWLINIDDSGQIIWQNTIGGSDIDQLSTLQSTSDSGYIIGGYSESNTSGDKTEDNIGLSDYWVLKLDTYGNIIWQNSLGGYGYDVLSEAIETTDGGFILGGRSDSNISGDKDENSQGEADYWIVKIDATGMIQWQNTIGSSDFDFFTAIQQTNDGGYIIGGFTKSNISGDKTENSYGKEDFWILKLDGQGNIEWQNTIGGAEYDGLRALLQTTDGGYILGGESLSNISGDKTENCIGGYDYWIVKLDDTGNIQWQNTIGGDSFDYLTSLQQTPDEGYVVGGYSLSNASGDKTANSNGYNDYWVVKLDNVGNIQWQKTIGGTSEDRLQCLDQTVDSNLILGGFSFSNISGDKTEDCLGSHDYWVIKLNNNTPTTDYLSDKFSLKVHPNPFDNFITINTNNSFSEGHLLIYNIMGDLVFKEHLTKVTQSLDISTNDWSPGIYEITLHTLDNRSSNRIRVIKME